MKNYSDSLDMFKKLCSLGVFVDNVETVIKCCCRLYRSNEAFSVLGCNLKQGDGLIFEDRILEAQTLFEKSVKQKLCEPNLLIFRLNDDFYQKLKASGPNSFEYNTMLKGFGIFGDDYGLADKMMQDAVKLWKEMDSQQGISPDVVTYNSLISALCKIEEARLVLYYMHEKGVDPNLVTFNSLINALCLKGDMTAAKALLNLMMSRGLRPDYETYSILVRSLFSAVHFGDGCKLLDEMRGQGHMLDGSAYQYILVNLFMQNQAELALSLFLLVGDSKLNSDISVYNHLIGGAIDCGKLDIAMDLFSDLRVKGMKPTNLTYTEMICAFSSGDLLDEAKELLREMEECGYKANDITYNCLLEGYLRNK
ncbi:tetratricopeptide repeat (TPR)-like superfamily protein [Artemisia annua]|uniref:Tetratricopeptide repeat (TPR)-like superfamily protein n=1 Tax=Artemisia annua TaxID=35608 RepID=A0A2U1P194_ARTAN|nr:tetratricopeptide repeat (TPR)-like superfamily protein [Artemisia annua]